MFQIFFSNFIKREFHYVSSFIFIDNMNVAWCSNEMILKKERDYDDNVGKIFRDNVTGNVEQYGDSEARKNLGPSVETPE